jgi:hypothetical protein
MTAPVSAPDRSRRQMPPTDGTSVSTGCPAQNMKDRNGKDSFFHHATHHLSVSGEHDTGRGDWGLPTLPTHVGAL